MDTQVNVIMVARSLWDMTHKALGTLIFTMSAPWKLVFVDNGSEDETRSEFKQIAPTWVWDRFNGYDKVFYPRGRGVSLSVAWNRAFDKVDKEVPYTLFANNDIVFHKFGWWDRFQEAVDAGLDLVGLQEMTWYQFRFVEGSLFAARTSTFEALKEDGKLFDPRFKLTCEDVDLSRRALQKGLKIGQVIGLQPDWLVHIGHQTLHHYGATEDLQGKMHASRRALCRKWGVPEKVED